MASYTFTDYAADAARTANMALDDRIERLTFACGIAGEAGEVADLIKKWEGHGHPEHPEVLKKELGDVLWYVAGLARKYSLSLEDIAQANIEKLRRRYPEGFNTEASLNRVDKIQAPVVEFESSEPLLADFEDWRCLCTVSNRAARLLCRSCGGERPGV